MLSASHNPYEDNGIKFFRHDGYKLDDAIEARIEQIVFSGEIEISARPPAPLGARRASTTRSGAMSNTQSAVFRAA